MLDTTLNTRVQVFLEQFETALAAGDLDATVAMFAPECYWRDLVAFTWNIKTMEGRDEVRDMLAHRLTDVKPRDWRVADGEVATEAGGVTEAWISFEGVLRRRRHLRVRNRADPDAAAAYNEAVKVGLTALKNAEKPTVAQIRG